MMIKNLLGCVRFLAVVGLTVLLGCGDVTRTGADFQIDNPTDQTMSVTIDSTTYTIEPMQSKMVTLSLGVHKLDSARTGALEFMVYANANDKGVLLNPAFATYYLVSEVYAENDKARQGFRPGVRTVTIDGVEYEGSVRTLEGLFINRQWTYQLDEPFPDSVEVYDNRKGAIKDKIFRKMDLVAYLEEQYGEVGKYASQHQKPVVTPVSYPDFGQALHTFEYEPVETAAKPLKVLYTAYLQNTDPAQLPAMQKAYFDAQMAFTKATATLIIKMNKSDREAYNQFVSTVSGLFGQSARVLQPPH